MDYAQFEAQAKQAGFTADQTQFMWSFLAHRPHTHVLEEIHDDDGETLDSILDSVM